MQVNTDRLRISPRLRRGFSLIELLIVLAVIAVLLALVLPAVQSARDAARTAKCQNQFRQLNLALQHRADLQPVLPLNQPLPWPMDLLPFAENTAFASQMAADQRMQSPQRTELIRETIPLLHCPADQPRDFEGLPVSNVGINPDLLGRRLNHCTDGLSNTLSFGELPSSLGFPWAGGPLVYLQALGSAHAGRWHAALLDGSVRPIPQNTDHRILAAILTVDQGETVQLP